MFWYPVRLRTEKLYFARLCYILQDFALFCEILLYFVISLCFVRFSYTLWDFTIFSKILQGEGQKSYILQDFAIFCKILLYFVRFCYILWFRYVLLDLAIFCKILLYFVRFWMFCEILLYFVRFCYILWDFARWRTEKLYFARFATWRTEKLAKYSFFCPLSKGSKGIRQWPKYWCISTKMIHKINFFVD